MIKIENKLNANHFTLILAHFLKGFFSDIHNQID